MQINTCLTLLLLAIAGVTIYGQKQPITVQDQAEDDYSIATVRYLMKQQPGFSTSFAEKQVARLGDRVSIALLKILDENDFKDSQKVSSILPLIKESFLRPELIAVKEDRNPKVTLFLLRKIESETKDARIKSDITQLMSFIKQTMESYEQKR